MRLGCIRPGPSLPGPGLEGRSHPDRVSSDRGRFGWLLRPDESPKGIGSGDYIAIKKVSERWTLPSQSWAEAAPGCKTAAMQCNLLFLYFILLHLVVFILLMNRPERIPISNVPRPGFLMSLTRKESSHEGFNVTNVQEPPVRNFNLSTSQVLTSTSNVSSIKTHPQILSTTNPTSAREARKIVPPRPIRPIEADFRPQIPGFNNFVWVYDLADKGTVEFEQIHPQAAIQVGLNYTAWYRQKFQKAHPVQQAPAKTEPKPINRIWIWGKRMPLHVVLRTPGDGLPRALRCHASWPFLWRAPLACASAC